MSLLFSRRHSGPERMDVEAIEPGVMAAVLTQLEAINRWLGGWRATLWHFERFSFFWPPERPISVIDWGTGGADLPRALVRWARRKGFSLKVTGMDRHPETLAYARKACREYPEIRILEGDVTQLPELHEPFDYAISSLTLHHLDDAAILELLRKSDRFVTRGIVMNDLKRSARAWAWIWGLSRLGHAHPMVQHDGPLSVRRGFTTDELEAFARKAGLSYLRARTHFGYRLTLAGEKC